MVGPSQASSPDSQERARSPYSGETKENQESYTDASARNSALAPALEHRGQSTEEQQNRAGGKNFDKHTLILRIATQRSNSSLDRARTQ
jgi:hypothetical protein